MKKIRVVVLISGGGSNLQAIIDASRAAEFPAQVVAVFSNRPAVHGLARAADAGIPGKVIEHSGFTDRAAFDQALQYEIDQYRPDLVVLAGFMRILTPEFVANYQGRMLNIHPSLLPKFPGLHTHRRALDENQSEHGTTVHFVTAQLDGGPAIIQAKVPVNNDDTEQTLADRVLQQEHKIYPIAVRWFAEGRLKLIEEKVLLDGLILPPGGSMYSDDRQG